MITGGLALEYTSLTYRIFDQKERDELVAYVNEALQFAKENGKEKALEVFNDPKAISQEMDVISLSLVTMDEPWPFLISQRQ